MPPKTIYLTDYRPAPYLIKDVDLVFNLAEESVLVKAHMHVYENERSREDKSCLVLNGRDLELVEVAVDGNLLRHDEYRLDLESLTILAPKKEFTLAVTTRIYPQNNTALEGLYRSSGNFCTQCEAQGFRKIVYFLDRPDVLAVYTVTIMADRTRYPVLLANGNMTGSGLLDDNRHWVSYKDPFPKPSYLFALVGGNLAKIADSFVTSSGRTISLQIYVEGHNRDKCDHAMASLKKAMRWDEETFGLEYDLDQYMIVAVDDFNMGAMENKGLNVFNSKYVLARPDTATDADYEGIEAVVAHEYFHNWTGNRVTCRDWFQLSLKEGLTVFRDQLFSGDMASHAVKRIGDVTLLRNRQFPEDGGPMAHPVRPASYIEINNFYTLTVYEKGAEIIRMLHTILGRARFTKGLRLYLDRHDGTGATTDDFVAAMQEAGGMNLDLFKRWYTQAGTQVLHIESEYLPEKGEFTLAIKQSCPATPGQPDKQPLHIPLAFGLLNPEGVDMAIKQGGGGADYKDGILHITEAAQAFSFTGIETKPCPSLLRGYSAPVKLEYDYSSADLSFLAAHDSDLFNRWEAGQRLALKLLMDIIEQIQQGLAPQMDANFCDIHRAVLADDSLTDKAFVCQFLTLPGEDYLAEHMAEIDVDAIHESREFVRINMARQLRDDLYGVYEENLITEPYHYDAGLAGRRRLKNLSLQYLALLGEKEIVSRCFSQLHRADNMTDEISALQILVNSCPAERVAALQAFYDKWRYDALVMDKWLSVQATVAEPDSLENVKNLQDKPVFSLTNPNKVRALLGAFCHTNPVAFHQSSGAGYEFIADRVMTLESKNPQIAARLLASMSRWRRFDESRREMMRTQLERVVNKENLSKDVYEVASRSLAE